jgi:hypothetical protein
MQKFEKIDLINEIRECIYMKNFKSCIHEGSCCHFEEISKGQIEIDYYALEQIIEKIYFLKIKNFEFKGVIDG